MPNINDIFKNAAALRDQLTEEQSKHIQQMYVDLAKKIAKKAKDPKYQLTQSGILQQQYLSELQKQIEAWSKELSNGLYTSTQSTMNLISDAVVQDNVNWLHSLGLGDKKGLTAAFSNVNQSVVNAIMTGSVYGGPGSWSLSKSIWGDNEKNLAKIYSLIAEGYAAQMPVGDIADMISKYVDPTKKLDWVGPNGKRIYGHKVDYNAQRLVRTLSQHTYQQSLVQCTQDNPFITGFVWIANGSRVCDLCKKRDGKFFKKEDLPLDHPNGMCVMRPAVKQTMTQDLAGWVKGTNKDPKIDAFAKKLGYDPDKDVAGMTLADIKKKYGHLAVGKKLPQFQKKLPKDVGEQFKKLKIDSGLSWDDFFTKNFDGAISEKLKAAKKVAPKLDDLASQLSDAKKAHKFGGSFFDEDAVHKYLAKFNEFDELYYSGPNNFYDMLKQMYPDDYEALLKLQKEKKMSKSAFYKTYFYKDSSTVKQKLDVLQDAFYDDFEGLLDKLSAYYDKGDILTPQSWQLETNPNDLFTKFSSKGVLNALKNAPEELQDDFVEFVLTYGKGKSHYSKFWKAKDFDALINNGGYYDLTQAMNVGSSQLGSKSIGDLYKKQGEAFMKKNGLSFDDVLDAQGKAAIKEAQEQAAKKAAEEAAKKALKDKQEKELKEKLEAALKDALVPSKNTQKRLDDALRFTSRREADKYHRDFVDKLWDELTDREKYSIWEYTHNSNPINKPLSGYANGSWKRSDFVGVGNADWATEDMWRYLDTKEFRKKFAKDASGHVSYERVIKDLTKAIQKSKIDDDVWVVRGSDYKGLAGMIEGDVFSFDDIMSIVKQDPSQLSMLEGLEVTNHAFTSTGIASDAGFDGEVQYKIFLPKGTQAIYAEPQSYYGRTIKNEEIYKVGAHYSYVGDEAEIILQRGTKFRINKVTSRGRNDVEIELEVVDQPTFSTGKEQTI